MGDAGGEPSHHAARRLVKRGLALGGGLGRATGATLLIYHRIGAATPDELDVASRDFAEQVERLQDAPVVTLDDAHERVRRGRRDHSVVLTFDDGFRDVHEVAWPLLRRAGLPFTIYLASGYVDRTMRWPGSTAVGEPGHGLTWDQLREMRDSGLMTIANHTHDHVPPEQLTAEQLDRCSQAIADELGMDARHFAYTWGRRAPEDATRLLRERFVTAATGEVGRNDSTVDPMLWRRVPVRGSDPIGFFAAKLSGGLGPERAYESLVRGVKAIT